MGPYFAGKPLGNTNNLFGTGEHTFTISFTRYIIGIYSTVIKFARVVSIRQTWKHKSSFKIILGNFLI